MALFDDFSIDRTPDDDIDNLSDDDLELVARHLDDLDPRLRAKIIDRINKRNIRVKTKKIQAQKYNAKKNGMGKLIKTISMLALAYKLANDHTDDKLTKEHIKALEKEAGSDSDAQSAVKSLQPGQSSKSIQTKIGQTITDAISKALGGQI